MGAVLNLVGAILCTIGSGTGAYGLYLMYVREPTDINWLFLVGGVTATVGGLVWAISALIFARQR